MTTPIKQAATFDLSLTLKALGGADNPQIAATASSTETDLSGDRFLRSALEQMKSSFPKMSIFLNHSYKVPEDVFGRVASATIVRRGGFDDLDLVIDVETTNPRALATYQQIRDGVTLGISVGVLVNSAREAPGGGLEISSVETLEASVVGIPANRRSWAHGALKAASYAVEHRTKADKGDAATIPALVAALSAMRVLVAAAEAERDSAEESLGKLWDEVNAVLDTPFGRKVDESIISNLESLASAHPELHPSIIASLARRES